MSIGLDIGKEVRKDYFKGKLIRLECQQLAESIISIKSLYNPSRRVGIAGRTKTIRRTRSKLSHVITFDAAIKIPPIKVNAITLKELNKYRMILFPETTYAPNGTRALNAKTKSLKQITSLLDKEIIGREINFTKHNLCHYCKCIKPLEQLINCNSENSEIHTSSKITLTIPTNKRSKQKTNLKKNGCRRSFCEECLETYLSIDAKSIESGSWICPCCCIDYESNHKGYCNCSRCMREQKILKCQEEFFLAGGLDTDIKKPIELLSRYAEDSFDFLIKGVSFF